MAGRRTPTIGNDLRRAREAVGISGRELAARADVSYETVRGTEQGDSYPTLRTLEALASILHIRVVIGPDETIVEEA